VAYRTSLLKMCTVRYRGFESLPLRRLKLPRSAANLYGIFGEKEILLSIRQKKLFHKDFLKIETRKGFCFRLISRYFYVILLLARFNNSRTRRTKW
jgi:hypothetical protein